ncbi:MAG: hypothetical protein WA021_03115 [Minisyncoccia bacterium]
MGTLERGYHKFKKQLANLLPEGTAASLENLRRDRLNMERKWTPVNDLLAYEVKGNELQIHAHELFIKSPSETQALLFAGLREIARQLEKDTHLQAIENVTGYSWLVYKLEPYFRRLGFEVTEHDHTKQTALATMPRATFIQKYGTSDK